jgi:hypothetical protein
VASIGEAALWRWLSQDAIRPWHHRSWIFPRDPLFADKASRVLDLYAGSWQGQPLQDSDFVICADEKTSVQARRRKHRSLAPQPARPMRVEHEYVRKGAWAYLAAWDVHRAHVFGRCERKTGIVPFGRLARQLMSREPYRSASRVFWVVDNGSSHRGERCQHRLARHLIVVHTPIHASWLNQVEIYFSIVRERSSLRTTSTLSPHSRSASSRSETATSQLPNPSGGASPVTTSPRFSTSLPHARRLPDRREYVTELLSWSTKTKARLRALRRREAWHADRAGDMPSRNRAGAADCRYHEVDAPSPSASTSTRSHSPRGCRAAVLCAPPPRASPRGLAADRIHAAAVRADEEAELQLALYVLHG